jgi:hypothetical protein
MFGLKKETTFGLLLISSSCLILLVASHGRLMEPPNRSSLWRFPEFDELGVPHNYEDNQLFCGGVAVIKNETLNYSG